MVKMNQLLQTKAFTLLNESTSTNVPINNIYICDLLSWVMSHAGEQCAWITVQTHVNIVAVAVLLEMSCIILPEGIKPEDATLKKASEEGIPILSTHLSAYEAACFFCNGNIHGEK